MVVGDHRVLSETGVQSGGVVGEDVLQERERPGATDDKSTHVGDVEESGRFPCGKMFLHDSGSVLNRHVPAAKIDHRSAEGNVFLMQNGFLELDHIFYSLFTECTAL